MLGEDTFPTPDVFFPIKGFFHYSDTEAISLPFFPSSTGGRVACGKRDKEGPACIAQPPPWEPPAHKIHELLLCFPLALHSQKASPRTGKPVAGVQN